MRTTYFTLQSSICSNASSAKAANGISLATLNPCASCRSIISFKVFFPWIKSIQSCYNIFVIENISNNCLNLKKLKRLRQIRSIISQNSHCHWKRFCRSFGASCIYYFKIFRLNFFAHFVRIFSLLRELDHCFLLNRPKAIIESKKLFCNHMASSTVTL